MSQDRRTQLDPFRAILGVIAGANNSETLVQTANLAGIRFDARVPDRPGFSHLMRIRELLPRISAAYDALPEMDQLIAANALLASLSRLKPEVADAAGTALVKIGWSTSGSQLVVAEPEVREIFFPKGTQWDAFVVLKRVMAEAKNDVLIIDAYCTGDVFQMLTPQSGLSVRILCSKYSDAIAAEAKRFSAQHAGVAIEVRKTRDFHDRFVVLDGQRCIHIGASLKDAGKTVFMISPIEDDSNRSALLASAVQAWEAGGTLHLVP